MLLALGTFDHSVKFPVHSVTHMCLDCLACDAQGANLSDAERAVKELDKQSCTVSRTSWWQGEGYSYIIIYLVIIILV